jgi:hypothetical protein
MRPIVARSEGHPTRGGTTISAPPSRDFDPLARGKLAGDVLDTRPRVPVSPVTKMCDVTAPATQRVSLARPLILPIGPRSQIGCIEMPQLVGVDDRSDGLHEAVDDIERYDRQRLPGPIE